MTVRRLALYELPEALGLVWRVFLEFEAPGYPEAGVRNFRDFIEYDSMAPQVESGERPFWCCVEDGRIVGVIALRDKTHICLLFVDKAHHRRGVARALFQAASQGMDFLTVFSSPYAVEAYRHLGFHPTGAEQLMNGLRFTPMRYEQESGNHNKDNGC